MGKFLDSLREGFEMVVDKTEELSKIGKVKVDIYSVKRDTEKKLTELGEKVFLLLEENANADVVNDEGVKKLIDVISSYKKKIEDKESEIDSIKEEKEKQRQEKKTKKEQEEPVDEVQEPAPEESEIEDAEFVEEDKKEE